jgi:hypothetical protein
MHWFIKGLGSVVCCEFFVAQPDSKELERSIRAETLGRWGLEAKQVPGILIERLTNAARF